MTAGFKRYRGRHVTTYAYTRPVYLDPHVIRVLPRSDPAQVVHDLAIDIRPAPSGLTKGLDAWGNSVAWAWFSGEHEHLEITTRFDVERTRVNPYDFTVPSEEAARIPPRYSLEEIDGLLPYLVKGDPGPAVRELAESTAADVGDDILGFARELADRIRLRCEMIIRPEGEAYRGEETLAQGRGSCRDFTVLYTEACRHLGVASRFVSGYVEEAPEDEPRELHAWSGVYVPGGGWRGFDATQGLAVSTGHVTCAVAASPAGAAPVTGTFRGDGARTQLSSTIEFEVEEKGGG